MKTLKHITKTLLILAVIGLASCSKEAGPQGEQGATGVAGPAGSTVLSGTVAPAVAKGKTGDFYLNITTSMFYGPKTASGWGNGVSMKGATGVAGIKGVAGSKIISCTGTPAATVGATGDYYLDKNSYAFYGPKLSSGWGTAISLKGATGTANVLYSGWLLSTNFRDTTADNSKLSAADVFAPALTDAVLNSGTMQVYFTFGGGVYPLPYTSFAGGKENTMSYWPRLRHFIITRFTADNSGTIPLSTLIQYRYVIIPGGKAAPTATKKPDINNYEEVKRFYNIPD